MIVVDTNVVAELMRPAPAAAVVAWMNGQSGASLYLTAITVAEIGYGLEILPDGRRRQGLERGLEQLVVGAFAQRILAFDEPAARRYAVLRGARRAMGRPLSPLDAQIAAIARAKGFAIATRNVRDFEGCGVEIVDPFAAAPRSAAP